MSLILSVVSTAIGKAFKSKAIISIVLVSVTHAATCGLYYKCFTIIIYDRNNSGQYYKQIL